jgi:anti-sigma regulatory factor (Ser/Thr protein kinase)
MEALAPRSGHYTFQADPRSISHARHAVKGFAHDNGVPGDLVDGIALAVSEACTNVVLHAYRDRERAGSISVDLELEARRLHIHVGDHGIGMRPRPDSPGLGLGLPIIASMADGFAVEPGIDGGTDLRMCFDLVAPFAAPSAPLVD